MFVGLLTVSELTMREFIKVLLVGIAALPAALAFGQTDVPS